MISPKMAIEHHYDIFCATVPYKGLDEKAYYASSRTKFHTPLRFPEIESLADKIFELGFDKIPKYNEEVSRFPMFFAFDFTPPYQAAMMVMPVEGPIENIFPLSIEEQRQFFTAFRERVELFYQNLLHDEK